MSRSCALVGLCFFFLLAGGDATAEPPSAKGWWWAGHPTNSAAPQFSPVPEVPDGGLYVAGDPAGPFGVSAMRFELSADVSQSVLTLAVADSIGTVIVDACPSMHPWEAVDDGPWDDRPTASCSAGRVTGTLSDDGSKVTFALDSLRSFGVLDFVLQPGTEPESGAGATFAVSFEPPASDALVVQRVARPSPPGPTAPPPSVDDPEPQFEPAPESDRDDAPLPLSPSTTDEHVSALPSTPVVRTSGSAPALEEFAYPAILALPLILLALGSYIAWLLTRPIRVGVPS